MYDLSVLIPSRNEEFLGKTIEDINANKRGNTEVIVLLDGELPVHPIPDHPDVTLVLRSKSIGQRAAINECAKLSQAKWVMKADAHCSFAEGFDVELMSACEPNWTVIPRQYNLHAFDWLCTSCGNRTYQGPQPQVCSKCNKPTIERDIIWKPRDGKEGRANKVTEAWRFDHELHFKYHGAWKKEGDLTETMSLLGACFFMERKRFWELEGCDEKTGSWGQQGTEVACKTWLSGGKLIVNKRTWFAHLFRTQPGFGFPYPISGNDQEKARARSRSVWLNNAWSRQIYPLSWLIDRFAPLPDWTDPHGAKRLEEVNKAGEEFYAERNSGGRASVGSNANIRSGIHSDRSSLMKGVVYYTENRCPEPIFSAVQNQIKRSINGHQLVSVSLQPIDFGDNVTLGLQRGILTMFQQILTGLSHSTADIVFLCEHDVLYSPDHFSFVPPRNDVFYYNEHTYKLDVATGQAVFYYTKQTSGLCAYRTLLIDHYRKRIEKCEQNARDLEAKGLPVKNQGFSRHLGFEPGCHQYPRGVDNFKAERWMSTVPNVDLRHSNNLTPSRWSQDQFRNPDACLGWNLVEEIPYWGRTKGRVNEFLSDVASGLSPKA